MKASAFRRWPVAGAYSPEQTTRLTGGSDWLQLKTFYLSVANVLKQILFTFLALCQGIVLL